MSYGYEMYSIGNIVDNCVIFCILTMTAKLIIVITLKCINISNHYVIYLKLILCYWICVSYSSIKLKNNVSPWGEKWSNYGMIKTRFIHSILSLGIYMSLFKGTLIFVVGPLSKILSLDRLTSNWCEFVHWERMI